MDSDTLRAIRAELVATMRFPALRASDDERAEERRHNETHLKLAELCDMFLQNSHREETK